MTRTSLYYAASGLALLVAFGGGPAWAADTSAATATTAVAETTIEPVIVTARRRQENLQRVPLTINAVTPDQLAKQSIRDTYDLQFVVPGLTLAPSANLANFAPNYIIRGQKAAGDDVPPGVVEYLADIPVYPNEVAYSNYDLSGVQVLKGPQGTLFGRNTNGGAVQFSPNPPTDHFEGYVSGRYGSFNDSYGEAMVNIPLANTLAVRLAGNVERRDGYTTNLGGPAADNVAYETFRGTILWKPTSNFRNETIVNSIYAQQVGPGWILNSVNPTGLGATFFNPAFPLYAYAQAAGFQLEDFSQAFAAQQARGVRIIDLPNPSTAFERAMGVGNITTFEWKGLTFKNLFGYHKSFTHSYNNSDDSVDDVLDVPANRDNHQLSEEFQVQGNALDHHLEFVTGFYYLNEKLSPGNGGYANDGFPLYPFLFEEKQIYREDRNSYSLYGQINYDFNSLVKGLTFTAGYRYTWDDASLIASNYVIYSALNIFGAPPGSTCGFGRTDIPGFFDAATCTLHDRKSWSGASWDLSLNYRVTDRAMLYLSSRHGYKSGGFNATVTTPNEAYLSFRPETMTDLEGGVKSDWNVGGVPIRANLSGWYDWYTNIQRNVTVYIPTPSVLIQNEDPLQACTGPTAVESTCLPSQANLYGADLSVSTILFNSLDVSVDYSYFHGHYSHWLFLNNSGVLTDGSKLQFAGVPTSQLNFIATYNFPKSATLGNVSATINYSYRTSAFQTDDNEPAGLFPNISLVNARVDWKNVMGRPIDGAFIVKNLTDAVVPLGFTGADAFGYSSKFYGAPREFDVQLTYHF